MTTTDTTRRVGRLVVWRRVLVASLGSLVAGFALLWPAWLFSVVLLPGDRSLVVTLCLAAVGLVGAIAPIFASTWLWHRMWLPGWPLGIVLMFVGARLAGALQSFVMPL